MLAVLIHSAGPLNKTDGVVDKRCLKLENYLTDDARPTEHWFGGKIKPPLPVSSSLEQHLADGQHIAGIAEV